MDEALLSREDARHLAVIQGKVRHPEAGLPDAVFRFALHVVPMINVDLVVLNDAGEALWVWRDDAYGCGWHIPGSIIRVGEAITTRIAETARNELSARIVAENAPRAIVQFFSVRGTFISLVYRCRLSPGASIAMAGDRERPDPGDLGWIAGMPEPVYPIHACYRTIMPVVLAPQAGAPLMLTVNE